MSLEKIPVGEERLITKICGDDINFKRRIMEMGFIVGASVKIIRKAPLGDPLLVKILGYSVAIRKSDAKNIYVV